MIPETTRLAGPFAGDDTTTVFPFTFVVFSGDDVKVTQSTDGVETVLTSGYTVSVNADQDADPGGDVTLTTALPTGDILAISGGTAYSQTLELPDGGNFSPASLNRALDRIVMQVQQLKEILDRTSATSVTDGADPALPSPVANAFLAWNSAGDALTNASGMASAPVSVAMTPVVAAATLALGRTALGATAVGDAVLVAASAAAARTAIGAQASGAYAASGANGDITSTTALTSINGGALAGLRNPLINPSFWINQEAPASNADDTYAHDGWYALTQTGAIALSTLTDQENGTPFMARLTQSQVTAQRMGYAQIIKGVDCKHLRGQQVTFRFGRTRLSTSANIRIAVLEWTGTEDSVTSDVVSNWASAAYTAGNFFLGASLTVSAVVQQALTAATLTTGSSVTATLGSTFNNLIVFAWTESTVAQNVTFDLAKAQLEVGGVATNFEQRPFGLDLNLCQRYWWKTYSLTTALGTSTNVGATRAYGDASGNGAQFIQWPVEMHAVPTLTQYNPNSGATGTWRTSGGTDITPTAVGTGTRGAGFTFSGAGVSNSVFGHMVASARL